MRVLSSSALAVVLLVGAITTPAVADHGRRVRGDFTVVIDFDTLTLTPVDGNCLLEVQGQVEFTGTLQGSAPSATRALVPPAASRSA